jgi:hypothetical protein
MPADKALSSDDHRPAGESPADAARRDTSTHLAAAYAELQDLLVDRRDVSDFLDQVTGC